MSAASTSNAEGRRYAFGGADRSSLPFGAAPAQAASVLLGAALAVVVLRLVPPPGGVVGAVVAAALGGIGAAERGGRSLVAWAAVWSSSTVRRAAWRARRRGRRPAGHHRRLPGSLDRFEALRSRSCPSGLGVLLDHRGRSASVLLALSGPAIDVEDPLGRDLRCQRWAEGLAAAARGASLPVRFSLVHAVEPDDARRVAVQLPAEPEESPAPELAEAACRYRALLELVARSSARRTVVLALSVPMRALERRSGSRDPAHWVAILEDEVRAVSGALEPEHGVAPVPPIGAQWWLRRAVDPYAPPAAVDRFPLRWPWPLEVEEHWDCLRMDQVWTAVYWLASWPRQAVDAGFLLPLLRPPSPARALCVVMEPVSAEGASSAAERRRTEMLADEELRRRGGFVLTARRRQAVVDLVRREEALAAGHEEFRLSAYLRVSAQGRDELVAGCRRAEQLAVAARVELRRCVGQQAEAFGWSLGLGRGLR